MDHGDGVRPKATNEDEARERFSHCVAPNTAVAFAEPVLHAGEPFIAVIFGACCCVKMMQVWATSEAEVKV